MAEISVAEVDQAEARLAEAKAEYYDQGGPDAPEEARAAFRDTKREVVQLRQAWRVQEEAAGRRAGMVGGDAVEEA